MVRWVERELDEELRYLQPRLAAERAAAAEEVPKSRMPSELKELELENNNFNNNFLEVASKEATRPPDPNTNPALWESMEKVDEQPQQGNCPSERRLGGNEGSADQSFHNGNNKQSPPNIEPARRPPPERDRYQKRGCRAYQTVSRKGVIDTSYPRI